VSRWHPCASLTIFAPMCGRVVQASDPLRHAFVDGLSVPDCRAKAPSYKCRAESASLRHPAEPRDRRAQARSAALGPDPARMHRPRWRPPSRSAGSGYSASTKRRILNRSASMPGASACRATRFSRSSTPSSSATTRPRQAPLPEIVPAEPATMRSTSAHLRELEARLARAGNAVSWCLRETNGGVGG
jgi:hypothetical protein